MARRRIRTKRSRILALGPLGLLACNPSTSGEEPPMDTPSDLTTTTTTDAADTTTYGDPTTNGPSSGTAHGSETTTGTSTGTGFADDSTTGDPKACDVLTAFGVTAIGDDGNVAENVLDGDSETRWSMQGVGSWIEIELLEPNLASGVSVAWYRGDERRNEFDIQISSDGVTYTDVFRGWSTGHSTEEETYGFGIDEVARYIRLTSHGNSLNDWASILELRVLGPGCAPWMQDVYLAIGQSNMAGRAPIEEQDLPSPDDVYVLTSEGHWTPASNERMGLNRYSSVEEADVGRTRLGPAYTFGRHMAMMTGRRVGLVVNARGGTTVEQWVVTDYAGEHALYDAAVARAKTALQNNPGATLRGVIWHQGEGNNNPTTSVTYVENIAEIVAGLRTDLDAPDAVFVAGEVGTWQGRGAYINPEIRHIPDVVPNSGWVSSEGLTTHETTTDPWGPHFDSASQRTLGERFAAEMLSLIGAP